MKRVRVSERETISVRCDGREMEIIALDVGRSRKGSATLGFVDPSDSFRVAKDDSRLDRPGRVAVAMGWCESVGAVVVFSRGKVTVEVSGVRFPRARFVEAAEEAMKWFEADPADPIPGYPRLAWDTRHSDEWPVVIGTKLTVRDVVSILDAARDWSNLFRVHPDLTFDSVRDCQNYHSARVSRGHSAGS